LGESTELSECSNFGYHQSLEIFKSQIVNVVENIPDEDLQRTCDMTKTEPKIYFGVHHQ
jgi:hypothetical protein